METPAPYTCQIAAKPCARFCENAECAPEPVAVPEAAPNIVERVHELVADNYGNGGDIADALLAEIVYPLQAELTQARQQLAVTSAEWMLLADAIREAAKVPLLTPGQARAIRTNTGGGGSAVAWSYGQTHGRAELAQELFSLISL